MDAFQELGIERKLVVSSEEVREAFRAAGKDRHPDAGGCPDDFARLREASERLSEPSRRLVHWLETGGIEGTMRGSVSSALMEWFGEIGPLLQEADALIRERGRASTALARAMLEGRVQSLRESLEALQDRLEVAEGERVERFPEVEQGRADGWELARELAFLGKWRAQVRERYAALW